MIASVALVCVIIVLYLWRNKRPNNFPPGPKALPIIGNLHQMPKGHLYPAVEEWSKMYGPIIGIQIVSDLIVMITGVDSIIAALRKEEFQSRPDNFVVRARSFHKKCMGVFFSTGEQWASTRKFVVKHLRAYSKNEKENIMLDECSRLMETIQDGSIVQANGLFRLAAVNIIWTTIANKRIDVKDTASGRFLTLLNDLFRQGSPSVDIVNILPLLRFVNSTYKRSQQIVKATQEYMRETIQEHREVLDPNNPIDLIDHYLIEMDRNKNNPDSYFSEEDLIMVGFDFFSAGAESTSNSCEFVLLYMVLYPEVQEKMQAELDLVLGRARKPTLEDKAQLNYTMAVLNEVERMNSIAPTNVPHVCTTDTTFGGYFIPKGTFISMNLRSLGYDSQYWKCPEDFNPERFLNGEGKYSRPSTCPTFGLGPRACVGEVMARNAIFLFTATFFEKFSIKLPPGEQEPSTIPLSGFTTAPQPFKIFIKSR